MEPERLLAFVAAMNELPRTLLIGVGLLAAGIVVLRAVRVK